jgi:hypothetical protein
MGEALQPVVIEWYSTRSALAMKPPFSTAHRAAGWGQADGAPPIRLNLLWLFLQMREATIFFAINARRSIELFFSSDRQATDWRPGAFHAMR